MIVSLNHGYLPIKQLKEREVTAKVTGAIATIAQKTEVAESELAFACAIDFGQGPAQPALMHVAGTKVYLLPDAAFQPWNKVVYEMDGIKFVRAPTHAVLGIKVNHGEQQ